MGHKANEILKEAEKIKDEMISHRRKIHSEAEIGFDLEHTVEYVKKVLDSIGVEYTDCGMCGVTAVIGDKKKKAFRLFSFVKVCHCNRTNNHPNCNKNKSTNSTNHFHF